MWLIIISAHEDDVARGSVVTNFTNCCDVLLKQIGITAFIRWYVDVAHQESGTTNVRGNTHLLQSSPVVRNKARAAVAFGYSNEDTTKAMFVAV